MRTEWNTSRPKPSISAAADAVRLRMASRGVLSDEEVLAMCENLAAELPEIRFMAAAEKRHFIRAVFCSLRCELEILQDYADDPSVSEIMINGRKDIFAERGGKMEKLDIEFESSEQLERVIQRLAARVGREMNDLNPIVDARLSDGSRINAVHSNIAIDGPVLTIRKFNSGRITIENLIEKGDITRDAADLLELLVACGYNMFVSGGTSSGKTTFLNILSDYIPAEERVIVIEDSAELQIRGHQNLVRMEAKAANAQGKGGITIKDLIKSSLRMRPDRIIVGEVRGGEVVDMLAAMSTGHDGSLSTGHANSPLGMIGRLETMHIASSGFPLQAVRNQIAESIDIFVHLTRFAGGHRRVTEISEVAGIENGEVKLNKLFTYDPEYGLSYTGNDLINKEKLMLNGRLQDLQLISY